MGVGEPECGAGRNVWNLGPGPGADKKQAPGVKLPHRLKVITRKICSSGPRGPTSLVSARGRVSGQDKQATGRAALTVQGPTAMSVTPA